MLFQAILRISMYVASFAMLALNGLAEKPKAPDLKQQQQQERERQRQLKQQQQSEDEEEGGGGAEAPGGGGGKDTQEMV